MPTVVVEVMRATAGGDQGRQHVPSRVAYLRFLRRERQQAPRSEVGR